MRSTIASLGLACAVLFANQSFGDDAGFVPPARFFIMSYTGDGRPTRTSECGFRTEYLGSVKSSDDAPYRCTLHFTPQSGGESKWLLDAKAAGYSYSPRSAANGVIALFGETYRVMQATGGVTLELADTSDFPGNVSVKPHAYVVPWEGSAALHGARLVVSYSELPGKEKSHVRLTVKGGDSGPKSTEVIIGNTIAIDGDRDHEGSHVHQVVNVVFPDHENTILGWVELGEEMEERRDE